MTVVLKPELEKLVSEKVQSGRYASAAQVLEEALMLLERRDRVEERLEALLQDADDRGEASDMTAQDWDDIEREGLTGLRSRKPA